MFLPHTIISWRLNATTLKDKRSVGGKLPDKFTFWFRSQCTIIKIKFDERILI
jgi:hypothetical protein